MSASNSHPGRPLLDSNFAPGLITQIVREEHAHEPEIRVSVEELKEAFLKLNCANVCRIIDQIEKDNSEGRILRQIGSGSIDLERVCGEKFSIANALRLQELYIGDPARGILPLQWLAYLLKGVGRIPSSLFPVFDLVCGALADFGDAAATATPMDTYSGDKDLRRRPISEIIAEACATKH